VILSRFISGARKSAAETREFVDPTLISSISLGRRRPMLEKVEDEAVPRRWPVQKVPMSGK
jgi:hypothetical protein